MTKGDGPATSNVAASAPSNNHSDSMNNNNNSNSQPGIRTTPRDTAIVTSLLNELGISEYEPRVIHQLLEFTYRYTTDILGKILCLRSPLDNNNTSFRLRFRRFTNVFIIC